MNAAPARGSFYDRAFSVAEREELAGARDIEGLRDEIAVLRVRLRDALAAHPEDFELVERGLRLLVQSLLAEHRVSSKEASSLTEAGAVFFEQFAGALRGAVE